MELTQQQGQAMQRIKEFIADKKAQIFILKGYAGTGKTTLIGQIKDYLDSLSLSVQLMAPTGRAAKILCEKLGENIATTIHKGIYEFSHMEVEESEGVLKYIFPIALNAGGGIYIVDEASMISSRKTKEELFQFGSGILLNDLLTYVRPAFGGKLIFIGDPMQLPPVGDNRSAALDEIYFKEHGLQVMSYELTEVFRQNKESCILANALKLRRLVEGKERNSLVLERKEGEVIDMNPEDVVENYCKKEDKDPDAKAIICFSNQQVTDYNKAIRAVRFPGVDHVTAGDKLLVVANNYHGDCQLMNGDLVTVVRVSDNVIPQSAPVWVDKDGIKRKEWITLSFRECLIETEEILKEPKVKKTLNCYIIDSLLENNRPSLSVDEMKALYISTVIRLRKKSGITNVKSKEFIQAVFNDPFYSALQVKYGYAFTCHKSQGGEWDTVYVDFLKRGGLDTDSLRWNYTAITRAKKMLWCVNLSDITPFSLLKIMPIGKMTKVPADALALRKVEETPFHPLSALPGVKAKYWSVISNMEGSCYAVRCVACKPWRDIYEVDTPEGIVRVDAIYNAAGLFTGYEMKVDDPRLMDCFRKEDNIRYAINYFPSMEALKSLYACMRSLCDECEITLTNVIEESYKVVYYMKTSGNYAALSFSFNAKGNISYAVPQSDKGEKDEKLRQLVGLLTERILCR